MKENLDLGEWTRGSKRGGMRVERGESCQQEGKEAGVETVLGEAVVTILWWLVGF